MHNLNIIKKYINYNYPDYNCILNNNVSLFLTNKNIHYKCRVRASEFIQYGCIFKSYKCTNLKIKLPIFIEIVINNV